MANTNNESKGISITEEDVEQRLDIQPKRSFCKVLLTSIEYRSSINKKTKLPYNSIDFVFVENETGYTTTINFIEPKSNSKLKTEQERVNAKRKLVQLKHLVHSYMVEGTNFVLNWDDTETFEQIHARIVAEVVPNFPEIHTLLKLVYSADFRNIQVPLIPNFISTSLKERELRISGNDIFEITTTSPKIEQSGNTAPAASATGGAAKGMW